MKKVQEMNKKEFEKAWKEAGDGDLVADNICKRWSSENGGFWFLANAGDCDGYDTIMAWYGDDRDDASYVEYLDARI